MRRPVLLRNLLRLQADLQQQGLRIPGAAGQFHGDAEGLPGRRISIVIPEIVQHLLDADRVGRRDFAVQNHPPQLGIGSRIHVRRKGGQGRGGGGLKAALPDPGVFVGIPGFR